MAEERVEELDAIMNMVNEITKERREEELLQLKIRARREVSQQKAFQRMATEAGTYCVIGAIAFLLAAYEMLDPHLAILAGAAGMAACILRIGQFLGGRS